MNADDPTSITLSFEPIGHVRSALQTKVDAGRQPGAFAGADGRIELLPGRNFEHALLDLEGWEYIWVIFCFHLNKGWRPKVLPPRSRSGRKGVFATRSPHRPNPLGLSAVRLERIEGLTLHLRDVDMLDGTPVLDIKPYVAYSDARPEARAGWLDPGVADPIPDHVIQFDALAARQAEWIEARTALGLRRRIEEALALGPEPHPYRRIRRNGSELQLAVKEWRVQCSVAGRDIHVLRILSGYRAAQLAQADPAAEPYATHRAFNAEFGAN
ncbi:MAG: tRNA (N6-threonylcarbamoyladenosine(37)-N6)-methyltransferase TrmO [Steroidobacteraceae bacterium]